MRTLFKKCVVALLTFEARYALGRFSPRIVAITGSVGKTTTKDAIFAALADFFYVRKSEKSYNSELGIPLAILGLENAWNNPLRWLSNIVKGAHTAFFGSSYPDWLVLEVGADRPGDIKAVASWLRPEIVVITRLADVPVHIEFFPSVERLVEEKSQLARQVKQGGTLILGSDDPRALSFCELAPAGTRVITFGTGTAAEVRGENYHIEYEKKPEGKPEGKTAKGFAFTVVCPGVAPLLVSVLGAVGAHLMQPVLAAFAVARSQGLDLSKVADSMGNFTPPLGRMRLIAGMGESILIDDTYNASPVAMSEALDTLASLEGGGSKVAVLGDMLELGSYSEQEHQKIGEKAAASADLLVAVGLRARSMAEAAEKAGMTKSVLRFDNSTEAATALQKVVRKGDIALVKGSQGARMEKIVKALMAEPSRARELLVRQEQEWEGR